MDSYEKALSDTLSNMSDDNSNSDSTGESKKVHVLPFKDLPNCQLYNQILLGNKTVEGRKYSKTYQKIKQSDTVLLSYRKRGILECDVTYVNLYGDIIEYLTVEGINKVFGDKTKCNVTNVDDGLKIYEQFVRNEDVRKIKSTYGYGFMGIGIKFKHEYKRISSTLQAKWFDLIVNGKKTVEARLNKGWISKLNPYDTIRFKRIADNADTGNTTKRNLIILVTKIKQYKSFYDMFDDNGLEVVLPGIDNYEDGLKVYRKWYSEADEKTIGVIGIFFTILD